MRYWSLLVAKLSIGAVLLYAVYFVMDALYTPPAHLLRFKHQAFLHDLGWTTLIMVFHLLVQGVLFVIIWDQRRRCRTCGRLLRMPVSHGRYGQILLFGRPRTEYICAYGHGTLTVPELHVGVREPSNWSANDDDIWKELYALDKASKQE